MTSILARESMYGGIMQRWLDPINTGLWCGWILALQQRGGIVVLTDVRGKPANDQRQESV